MVAGPLITPYTDASPMPRVELFFATFAAGTTSVTVYRSALGRERRVRGAIDAPTAGTLTRIDFEVPFNTPVAYRAEMFDEGGGSLGFTDASTLGDVVEGLSPSAALSPSASLAPGEVVVGSGLVVRDSWIHNPLLPSGGVRVELAPSTGSAISRPVPGIVSRPLGRRVGVVLSEPRSGVSGLQFDVHAADLDTADRVQRLLGTDRDPTVPVVCIRLGRDDARLRIPQPFFMSAFDIAEVAVDVRWGGTTTIQQMQGDEVDPPIPGLFVPLLTAADINASFATARALNISHRRAVDVNRRYDLAGAASQGV